MAAKWLRILVPIALVMIFIVIALGAYTRLTHSGLGCPDWPGCYGFVTVPEEVHEIAAAGIRFPEHEVEAEKGWIEMIHRYAAGVTLLTIFTAVIVALTGRRKGESVPLVHLVVVLSVILLQAAFGMWTVTLKLWPQVVTAHLLGGFTTFSLVYLLWVRGKNLPPLAIGKAGKYGVLAAFLVVLMQVILGGWVASNYAALACPDLPTCQGQWWPQADFAHGFNFSQTVGPNYLGGQLEGEGRVAIHFAHRIGAIVTLFAIIAIAVYMYSKNKKLSLRLGFLVGLQCTLGIANVLFHIPIQIAVLHNLVAALLLASMLETLYLAWRAKHRTGEKYAFNLATR